jgi:hypothetical protein
MPHPLDNRLLTRRSAIAAILGGGAAALTGCAKDGHFGFLGYTTAPNYDPEIRTVYVPMFRTRMLETNPYRGVEMTLERQVVDNIEHKTPMKVLSDPGGADSELQCTVVSVSKVLTNRTPQNEVREMALHLYVEIVWHDLRPGHEGKILTNPSRDTKVILPGDVPFDPGVPPPQVKPDKPQPVILSTIGRAIPELGESNTTALQMAINRMADQIISAMEKPWHLPKSTNSMPER